MDKVAKGFAKDMAPFTEPVTRLEHSASISSIKFFEDNPQTLVIGLKSQGLRVYDLRDPSTAQLQFSTRCNNNLAIDPDPNYFASSALDQPGVLVWDRRATSRAVASPAYLSAVDEEEVSWGAALSLQNAVETDEPSLGDSKHSLVRSLRYCRDHRGLLGVLTRTGQLKVLQTNREHTSAEMELAGSPELMQVKKSYEMDVNFSDSNSKNDRIVSFDWVTLGSNPLQPRVLALRANGAMEILEQPSHASDHLYKLSSWKSPHRGLEDGAGYQSLLNFEPSQCADMYGPLLLEQALSDVPLFGKKKANIPAVIEKTLRSNPSAADVKTERPSHLSIYPETLHGHSIAYVGKFNDFQTATLVMSICAPRYIDDYRCTAWRNAYRAYLQRHKAFFLRTKFEVESTKKSKRDGRPTIKPPSRQIALRCVFCDAETTVPSHNGSAPPAGAPDTRNPLMVTSISAGVSCPNCGRHLPRCVVCLEVVGIPRSDRPEAAADMDTRMAARFPTFCLKCEHVLHLDHARHWFARHVECPVPECRCKCNFRANPELNYH
ncbi:putative WD repeat-containing protein C12G12.01c like [Verticillium longisporum]|nr:putative WD repeat-containing protein C12G12.01c like [Verticillium longisporum]